MTPRWWFRPVPLARIAVFRVIAYLFIPVDVFLTTAWVRAHADVPTEWYAPLTIGRLLPLPTPTPAVVFVVQWALVLTAVLAATGRAPRLHSCQSLGRLECRLNALDRSSLIEEHMVRIETPDLCQIC